MRSVNRQICIIIAILIYYAKYIEKTLRLTHFLSISHMYVRCERRNETNACCSKKQQQQNKRICVHTHTKESW